MRSNIAIALLEGLLPHPQDLFLGGTMAQDGGALPASIPIFTFTPPLVMSRARGLALIQSPEMIPISPRVGAQSVTKRM
ncbi:MAG TPA: hypothetical protein G4O11_06950 [Anaerolineae bacterium]|nr:hypothetical protein [Anaerolineae bacterium]